MMQVFYPVLGAYMKRRVKFQGDDSVFLSGHSLFLEPSRSTSRGSQFEDFLSGIQTNLSEMDAILCSPTR
ncbi:hypothetical protein Pla144_38190 [Bythopirellula polymerisocia]|uniref:Uncharacterized protein n=1 Tax=Bythopirellula polymerisocia TaxID=2528003 RepID=A0A5C6CJJ0_9BACT|nr:hypothetical protein Pla144_38190 [Bythopirellula polymerisocia]